jgi:hypothetical protein
MRSLRFWFIDAPALLWDGFWLFYRVLLAVLSASCIVFMLVWWLRVFLGYQHP